MEGSPDQNINEDRGCKSDDLSDGETPISKSGVSDEKLVKVEKIKMFPYLYNMDQIPKKLKNKLLCT
jgi:hypothetical protein